MIPSAITCDPPPAGTNTKDIPEELLEDGLTYLQSYTYSCLDGFFTTDEVFTKCQSDGSLSLADPPECSRRFKMK